jgi:hypothetical protein
MELLTHEARRYRECICSRSIGTYVIDGDEFSIVFEDHDLIFRVTSCRIFPVINRNFNGFGTVFTGHVKNATSRCVFV